MNLIKLSVYVVGGAVGLSAAAGFGGIGADLHRQHFPFHPGWL